MVYQPDLSPSLLRQLFVAHLHCQWPQILKLGAAIAVATSFPAQSAERIEFFIGPFEPVIWVEDLETLAESGTVTQRFRPFANRLNGEQLQELQLFLNQSLEVDLLTISQFTYWQVGERFLNRLGQVVQTNNFLNGSKALRAALIFASADENGITPLEVLQNYPLDVIQLDFQLLRQLIQENRQFFTSRDEVLTQLRAAAISEVPTTISEPSKLTHSPTDPGIYPWQKESLTFQNPLRQGNIPFDIYSPQLQSVKPIPIVVLSHGVASGRNAFVYLAEHLVSHGYAVIVPEHDDDSQKYFQFLAGVDRPPNPITLVSRSRDISLVLDKLEKLAQSQSNYSYLDFDNVGVFGHSLGGFTALATAGAELNFVQVQQSCSLEDRNRPSLNPSLLVQCDLLDLLEQAPLKLQDERIRAVFALNPPTSLFFGEAGLAQIEIPTLLMAATADIVVPAIPEQIVPYKWIKTEDRYLAVVENATHFTFLEGDLSEGAIPLPSDLLGPDPYLARSYLKALGLAFFDRHLLDQTSAEKFLTQSYLDSLSTDPFNLTLVRSLRAD